MEEAVAVVLAAEAVLVVAVLLLLVVAALLEVVAARRGAAEAEGVALALEGEWVEEAEAEWERVEAALVQDGLPGQASKTTEPTGTTAES